MDLNGLFIKFNLQAVCEWTSSVPVNVYWSAGRPESGSCTPAVFSLLVRVAFDIPLMSFSFASLVT